MYLHIGNHRNLRTRGIVGIFDLDSASVSSVTKNFLRRREKEGKLRADFAELPRSFVLTDGGEVYLSQISSVSLIGRAARGEAAQWRVESGELRVDS